ncbi:MAG: hypothetical protein AMJ46_07580 [Latescibacteria bacterium DG_63]|uniref:Peptidase M10 metallopeptidase domain-containing protein n=1 Tax=candidate division TA06 bacterium SM23_40 TaxID=1703774 RepID=A0A0S8GBD6_UNCT6|nr:MAG: hypothetical protein AMJ46_07580 [Latescibacteria bacterium DG_63]KPK69133.1 MAG: hypothetical protein AMJ82_06460 [candidate division TA06 bacterium SM23_40]
MRTLSRSLFVAGCLLVAPLLVSSALGYAFCNMSWNWQTYPMGEDVLLNPNCIDPNVGTQNQQLEAYLNGLEAWNNEGTADFIFTYGGRTSIVGNIHDGHNVASFVNYNTGSIATTYIWGGYNISECDVIFNDYSYSWNADGWPLSNEMDVWNIAAHEFGHFLCLDHSSYSAATMYAYASYGETYKRDLYFDDINGIVALYGSAGSQDIIIQFQPQSTTIARGDTLKIDVTATNNSSSSVSCTFWTTAFLPNGSLYDVFGPFNVNFSPSQTKNGTLKHKIPNAAPCGDFMYNGYIGQYTYDKWDMEHFAFTVTMSGDNTGPARARGLTTVSATGELFE